jgi:hypothetical protein
VEPIFGDRIHRKSSNYLPCALLLFLHL